MINFDKLNRETKDWNNGFSGRTIGWCDATGIYNNGYKKTEKKGHYDGRGCYVED
jgi:hypothetical protein